MRLRHVSSSKVVRFAPFAAALLALLPAFASASSQKSEFSGPSGTTGLAGAGAGAQAPADLKVVSQVAIEQQGRLVALGVVLGGDGRILSSIRVSEANSPKVADGLTSRDVTVRYATGAKVRAKILHTDAETGLALVVPQEGRRTEGVKASTEDPTAAPAHVQKAGKDSPLQLTTAPTMGAFLTAQTNTDDLKPGTPLFDGASAVLAVTVRQCTGGAPKPTCTTVFAPVPVIRAFLSKTPPGATIPSAWLGIGGEALDTGAVRGVRVIAVAPNSPAAASGLAAAPEVDKTDIILAVDGEAVATPEALGARISAHGVGDKAKLLVFRGNRLRDVLVTLKSAP